jgi:hypothetical protein
MPEKLSERKIDTSPAAVDAVLDDMQSGQNELDAMGLIEALSFDLDAAHAKIERLESATAPIWGIVNLYEGMDDDRTVFVPLGHLRRARAALSETEEKRK